MSLKNQKAAGLEQSMEEKLKLDLATSDALTPEQIAAIDKNEFALVDYDDSDAERIGYSNYSYWTATLRMFLKNKLAVAMLIIVVAMIAFTFIQPYLPNQRDPYIVYNDPATGMPASNLSPSSEYWFGTNKIGQDLWSRIWDGTATSLFIGFTVAIVEAILGILMGVLWGYVRKLDFIFTEIYNIIDNVPQTIILVLFSYILKPGISTIILAMCLTGWIGLARFIRNQVLIIRDRDYNLASRCLGTPTHRVIMKNLLPHMVSVIMLRMALDIPGAIGNEVFLTYIGLGLPLEIPSLGNLVNTGRSLMMSETLRYQLFIPAIFLAIITICFYLIGNSFADAADPKNHV